MTHTQHYSRPNVPAENFAGTVVRWQDRYFTVKAGQWKEVTIISKEVEEDHENRLAIKLGAGAAGFICALILWGMFSVFFDSIPTVPAALDGFVVTMTGSMFVAGIIGTLLGIIEWLRYRGTVAVVEQGSLWGLAEQLTGTPEFIDLD